MHVQHQSYFSIGLCSKCVPGWLGIQKKTFQLTLYKPPVYMTLPVGDKHISDSPEAAGHRGTNLSYSPGTNVAADRCQPSLMFMPELFSPCVADVISSLLLLMNNVWQ